MLEVARQQKRPALVQADGLQLPFRDQSFDAITVAFGLRNMASWEGALREMRRLLRPGGLLLGDGFFAAPLSSPARHLSRLPHMVLPRIGRSSHRK